MRSSTMHEYYQSPRDCSAHHLVGWPDAGTNKSGRSNGITQHCTLIASLSMVLERVDYWAVEHDSERHWMPLETIRRPNDARS